MKTIGLFVIVFVMFGLSTSHAQDWQYPVIKKYGGIVPVKNANALPAKLEYKILIDLVHGGKPGDVNGGLNHVARLINVFDLGGMSWKDLNIVVIAHGEAVNVTFTNDAYKKLYSMDNPNMELLKQLKEHGAQLFVCGQALADNHATESEVNSYFKVALSALVVVPTYQLEGYAYMPM